MTRKQAELLTGCGVDVDVLLGTPGLPYFPVTIGSVNIFFSFSQRHFDFTDYKGGAEGEE